MKVNISIGIPAWLDKSCVWPVMVYRRRKYGYDFRRIYLGDDEWTKVDPADYYRFGHLKWHIRGSSGKRFYAVRDVKIGHGRTKQSCLHREIMNNPKGFIVDHKNGDSLDNRRANLRLATPSQNTCNRRKSGRKTASRFVGLAFVKSRNKWSCRIKVQGKRIWLGNFDNEIEAAKARDEAAKKYHGEFARLNFPETA